MIYKFINVCELNECSEVGRKNYKNEEKEYFNLWIVFASFICNRYKCRSKNLYNI